MKRTVIRVMLLALANGSRRSAANKEESWRAARNNWQKHLLVKGDGDAVHDVGLYARNRNGEGFTGRDGQGLCWARRRSTGDPAERNFSGSRSFEVHFHGDACSPEGRENA